MPPSRRISQSIIKEMLEQGLEELLAMIPDYAEPTLEVHITDSLFGTATPSEQDPYTALDFLCAATRFIGGLRNHFPPEEVMDLLTAKGGLQALLSGTTDHWWQQYVD